MPCSIPLPVRTYGYWDAGNPYGPAGTGKTESVKALGAALGRQVLVFNCDEGIDFQSMVRSSLVALLLVGVNVRLSVLSVSKDSYLCIHRPHSGCIHLGNPCVLVSVLVYGLVCAG